eukprot:2666322-Rhodomonas_salina.2
MPKSSKVASSRSADIERRATALRDLAISRQRSACSSPRTVWSPTPEPPSNLPADQPAVRDVYAAEAAKPVIGLPAGCVMGLPVALGRPIFCVQGNDGGMEAAIMRSIRGDNYAFLRQAMMSGWAPINPCSCNFTISFCLDRDSEPELMSMRHNTPLHYALCCGSMQCAMALLVAFPHLVSLKCSWQRGNGSTGATETWTTLELVSFFSSLYEGKDERRHSNYFLASQVLRCLAENPQVLPFVNMPSPMQRLLEIGTNAEAATTSLAQSAAVWCATHDMSRARAQQ